METRTETVPARTLAGLLDSRAGAEPDRVAMRHKRLGLWHEITWAEYAAAARAVAGGLRAAGVAPGDQVVLAAGNRPEWPFAELGALLAGAVPVVVDLDRPAGGLAEALAETRARVLFADDEEQLDKALEAGPHLTLIVVLDSRGLVIEDPRVVRFADFGGEHAPPPAGPASPRLYEAGLALGDPRPDRLGLRPSDELLSHLPPSGPAEHLFSLVHHLRTGYVVNFGAAADLTAIRPTVLFGGPELWDEIRADAVARLAAATRLKRAVSGRDWPGGLGALLVHRPLRARLGLNRVRLALCGPGPAGAETVAWFARLGLDLAAYDPTEEIQR